MDTWRVEPRHERRIGLAAEIAPSAGSIGRVKSEYQKTFQRHKSLAESASGLYQELRVPSREFSPLAGEGGSADCIGNRIHTDIGDDELYVAVRGADLERIVAEARTIAHQRAFGGVPSRQAAGTFHSLSTVWKKAIT